MGRIKIGDIFEVTINGTFGYFQYTHLNKLMGNLIRVPKARFRKKQPPSEPFERFECHAVFFPLSATLSDGVFQRLGNFIVSEKLAAFPLFKVGVQAPDIGLFQTRGVWDGEKEVALPSSVSSIEDLPEREIITYPLLVDMFKDFTIN